MDSWLQYAWFNNDVSEHEDGVDRYRSSGLSPRWKSGISGYRGCGVVIEPQAQGDLSGRAAG
ncbi:autotransporter outer membrane beta-barrel domain-containing protein [Shigella flexneri]